MGSQGCKCSSTAKRRGVDAQELADRYDESHNCTRLGWNGHWVDPSALERFPAFISLASLPAMSAMSSSMLTFETRVDSLGQILAVVLPQPREKFGAETPLWRK